MNLELPPDRSVIVFASYRSGSTALCDFISEKYNFVNFDEVFHEASVNQEALNNVYQKDLVVIKVMPDQINLCQAEVDKIRRYRPCTLIRLTRADVVKQIASYYLCARRNIWHQTLDETHASYTIEIDTDILANEINYIKDCNKILSNLNYKFTHEIEYTALTELDTKYKLSTKPSNYNELITTIENLI